MSQSIVRFTTYTCVSTVAPSGGEFKVINDEDTELKLVKVESSLKNICQN